jgi:PKD repeat protein
MSWHYNFKGFVLSLVILATLLFLNSAVHAQYPKFVWASRAGGTYLDSGYGVVTDNSGNTFVVGYFSRSADFGSITLSSAGDEDIFIAKYDGSGNVVWAKKAGGTGRDNGLGIAIDESDNLVITGSFQKTAFFENISLISAGDCDVFIAKYNSSGGLIWVKQAGGIVEETAHSVATDIAGNIFITGQFEGKINFGNISLTGVGKQDIFITMYDASGNVIWAKQAGGADNDGGEGIAVDGSGSSVITGYFEGTANFDTKTLIGEGWDSMFIAKYDNSGKLLWAKKAISECSVIAEDIAIDRSGNCLVTGWFAGTAIFDSATLPGSSDYREIFIAKYNASGNLVWAKSDGGERDDKGNGIAADNAGNIFVTGWFSKTAYFDNISLTSIGGSDIFVTKYNALGNILWAERAGAFSSEGGADIVIDHSGSCIILGDFNQSAEFGRHWLTSVGLRDIFITKIKEVPILAKFTASPTQGVAPLSIQFTDQSKGQITSWLWDFGDGTTSTQQNPIHIYDPQIDPKFTVSLKVTGPEGTDTETKVDYITVYLPVHADFDADRTVGTAPIEVHFKNLTTGSADTYEWSFGDHCYSKEFEPSKLYDEPGVYHVSLKASGPGGHDTEYREGFITIYADSGYLHLSFVKGSAAYPEEPWNNAIDGDTWGWDGTATVQGDTTYAIFEFKNQALKKVNRFRLMTDTGVHFKDRWVTAFRVQVSTTGMLPADFTTVLDTIKAGGAWQYYKIPPADAKYVKLIIDEPIQGWRQVGEFEVWEYLNLPDPMLSTITATTPHFSTGVDSSIITLKLLDAYGAPVAGKAGKIQLHATGSDNHFGNIIETANPGFYTARLTTMVAESKTIKAVVQGIEIKYSNPDSQKICTVTFVEPPSALTTLELVKNSYAYPGEGWDNAIDGDIKGWDGTVTATGWPPFAIFKFADNTIHAIHKIKLMTDTGVRYSDRWVTDFRVFVSTTGTAEIDFKLILTGRQTTGNWQNYFFTQTDAKYIKLVLDTPTDTWCQLGELEVYEVDMIGPVLADNFVATNNKANSALSPDQFALLQNYPNPFNPETTIRYDLADHARVTIVVYNINGQEVRRLIDQTENAGRYMVVWDGTDNFGGQIAAGIYIYRITAEFKDQLFSETKRMILLR